jgi:hypothetical protein
MHRKRLLALPGYSVAFLLVLFPLLDMALSVWPVRAGELAWRFGATGLFSRVLITPLLGLLLAFAVAVLLEQRRVLRGISILSGLVGLAIVGGVILFLLDALQMRPRVRAEAKMAFDMTTVVALAKYGFGVLVLSAFAVTGWKSSKGESAAEGKRVPEGGATVGLIVGHRAKA